MDKNRPRILIPGALRGRGRLTLRVKMTLCDAIAELGGLPLVIPPYRDEDSARASLEIAAGLVIPGGIDIDATSYGEENLRPRNIENADRQRSDRMLLDLARPAGLPVLGICYGIQMMNVHAGGSLYQDIATQIPDSAAHGKPDVSVIHDVEVGPSSRLAQIVSQPSFEVSSSHRQAVRRLGDGLEVSARAPDGVVEAIEDPQHPFYVGVEWHPEQFHADADRRILAAFVDAARKSEV